MAGRHPHDALGLVLPEASWPHDRQAPEPLELVRRFCNSVNRESGGERFRSPAELDAWLALEGLPPANAGSAGLRDLVAAREVLHDLVVANGEHRHDAAAWHRLAKALPNTPLRFIAGPGGLTLRANATGVDGLLAHLGTIIAGAIADGTWQRLKACHHCHWVVYDPSKNRSSRWCSMRACGGRANAKAYRARRGERVGDDPG